MGRNQDLGATVLGRQRNPGQALVLTTGPPGRCRIPRAPSWRRSLAHTISGLTVGPWSFENARINSELILNLFFFFSLTFSFLHEQYFSVHIEDRHPDQNPSVYSFAKD